MNRDILFDVRFHDGIPQSHVCDCALTPDLGSVERLQEDDMERIGWTWRWTIS